MSGRYRRTPGSRARLYRPLEQYLAALPATQGRIRLTLAELAALLGPAGGEAAGSIPRWYAGAIAVTFRHRRRYHATYNRADGAIIFTRREPATSTVEAS